MTRITYEHAIVWIVRERGGGNSPPPRNCNVRDVAGWKTTRFAAFMFGKATREVAADVIEFDHLHEYGKTDEETETPF